MSSVSKPAIDQSKGENLSVSNEDDELFESEMFESHNVNINIGGMKRRVHTFSHELFI